MGPRTVVRISLCLPLFAALASAQEGAAPRLPVKAGLTELTDIARRWGAAVGRVPQVEPGLETLKLRFLDDATLDLPTLRAVLEGHHVLVTDAPGLLVFSAARSTHLLQRPFSSLAWDADPLPAGRELVTLVLPVRHGHAQTLFYALRSLLAHDPLRLGALHLVEGSAESLVVVDLADRAGYVRRLLRALDRPAPEPRLRLEVYEVPRAAWRRIAEAGDDAARAEGLAKAAGAGQATLLDEAEAPVVRDRLHLGSEARTGDGELLTTTLDLSPPPVLKDRAAPPQDVVQVDLRVVRHRAGEAQKEREQLQRSAIFYLPQRAIGQGTRVVALGLRPGAGATLVVVVLRGAAR